MRAFLFRCLTSSFIGSCFALSFGQTAPAKGPGTPNTPAVADYAAEPVVLISRQSVTTMKADGTGTTEITYSMHLQSDAVVRQFSVLSFPFSGNTQRADFVYARVRHADGTVVETPVTDALEQPAEVTREAPFYSDLKQKQLPVRSLRVGDTLEWQTRLVHTKAEIPNQFWGQDNFITQGIALRETAELRVPAASQVKIWTDPDMTAPTDTVANGERIVRWTHTNLQRTVGPEATAAAEAAKTKRLTAEQELTNQKGALPSFGWTTFPDWPAVGTWYRGLSADRAVPDSAIKAKVAELTAGKTTDDDKARAVYDFVATQIRYIGVAFGLGRYQPHMASEAFANQYGDCKDKHTLLAAMLAELGLHPEAVLIGAGVRFNQALPSPAAFNHLITHVVIGGKEYWLDTTQEVAPWNTLVPTLRDQQALVIPPQKQPFLEQTPAQPPFLGTSDMTVAETLDKDLNSDAHIILKFHDDDAIALRSVLRQISPAQYNDFVQRFMAQWGFGGTTSEASLSRIDAIEEPIQITFRYKRTRDTDWGTNRITEPFMPITLPSVDEKQPPVSAVQLGAPRRETSTVTIDLPGGWNAELPEAVHAKAPFATVDMTFHLENGKLVAERQLNILETSVPAEDWKAYKSWSDQAQLYSVPFIQMVPISERSATGNITSKVAAPSSEPPDASQAHLEALIRQAGDQLRAMDIEGARKDLAEVKATKPDERGLWAAYGGIALQLGEVNEAIVDIHKELALHPDELQMYGYLAESQRYHGDAEGAVTTLQSWVAAAPDDPAANTALVRALHNAKRNTEAIKAGTAVLERLAKNSDADLTALRLQVASLQHDSGHKAEAAETVQPLQATVTDPAAINSVAYFMADGGLDLPGDEKREREAIQTIEAETAAWTLDESPSVMATQTSLLIASWDTLGWILYLEGHVGEAKPFIEAAWRNSPTGDINAHLQAIEAATHQTSTWDEHGSEQARRTFALGPAKGRHGTTDVRLLLGADGVVRAEPNLHTAVPGAPTPTKTSPDVPGALELAKAAKVEALLPSGSKARLVRYGFVTCFGEVCQLVLSPVSFR